MLRTERYYLLSYIILVWVVAGASASAQDLVEFLNGTTITGTIKEIRKSDKEFDIEVKIGNRAMIRSYSFSQVHAVTMQGKRYVLTWKQAPPSAAGEVTRSRDEVNRLINELGTSPPDWFDSVSLNYPRSIDLSWPQPSGPWDPRKNVGQFMWSVINENPGRWKEGTKFMHHVLSINQDNPEVQQKAFTQLGHCYHDLLGDWARGACWWRKRQRHDMNSFLGLANCYWKLGCKEMAVEQLSGIRTDFSRYGSAVKLWSDLGELDRALALAEASAQAGYPGGAYASAGDACRRHKRYTEAIAYYRKAIALPMTYTQNNGKRQKNAILVRNQERAQTAVDNIKLFETLDVSRIPDGTYTGTSLAYAGDLTVAVTVKSGRMTAVRVTENKDKQYYAALTDTPKQIIAKQALQGIDATTGATITAQAIVDATAGALAGKLD